MQKIKYAHIHFRLSRDWQFILAQNSLWKPCREHSGKKWWTHGSRSRASSPETSRPSFTVTQQTPRLKRLTTSVLRSRHWRASTLRKQSFTRLRHLAMLPSTKSLLSQERRPYKSEVEWYCRRLKGMLISLIMTQVDFFLLRI